MIKDKQNQLKDSREKAAVPGSPGKQAEEEKKEEKQDKITYEYLTLLNSQRELDGVRIATEQTMTSPRCFRPMAQTSLCQPSAGLQASINAS